MQVSVVAAGKQCTQLKSVHTKRSILYSFSLLNAAYLPRYVVYLEDTLYEMHIYKI